MELYTLFFRLLLKRKERGMCVNFIRKSGTKKVSSRQKKERITSALFLTPSVIGVLVFFILPFAMVIYYSLINNPYQKKFVGFDNFLALFDNYAFKTAAVNTLKFSLVCVPLAVVLSLLLAMALNCRIPMQSKLRSFFLSPMMVPTASVVLVWQVLFHYNGTVNDFLAFFGVEKNDWLKSEHAIWVVVMLFLWKNLGYNMILFLAALNNIPKDVLEVATVEGAGPVRQFFSIKLRYLSSTILFVAIISLINSFKIFREVYLLSGDYPYESLYMLQHFMNNTFASLDYQKLSAAAIIMAVVMVIIIGILFVADDKYGKDVEE